MKYHDYFSVFLDIEEELLSFIKVLPYSPKSKTLYSHKLMLLLLQTCPVIESYMIRLSTLSPTVKESKLYGWKYNWRLWEKEKNNNRIKEREGLRSISGFPKFAYVTEKVFNISKQGVDFYHSDKFQGVEKAGVSVIRPFSTLSKFENFQPIDADPKGTPKGLDTPQWWTAYNKVKHTFESHAQERVNYEIVIEAISALFLLLCYCDMDEDILLSHGYITDNNGEKELRTKLFRASVE